MQKKINQATTTNYVDFESSIDATNNPRVLRLTDLKEEQEYKVEFGEVSII